MKTFKNGTVVKFTILDHAQYSGVPNGQLEFDVYGVIVHQNKHYYFVSNWVDSNGDIDGNMESIAVLKKVIIKAKVLR